MRDSAVVDQAHAGQLSARTQHLRRRLDDRARLRAAVALTLHGGAVDAERDVVEERAAVHLAHVDRPLERVRECVERTDEVRRIQAEVAGEVVSRSGGNAYERDSVGARGRRHDPQRSVTSGHAEHVGAVGRGCLGHDAQVVARLKDDRLDATFASRVGEPRASCPSAAGPRIHEQHRPPGRVHET
jgi:hypothetical protein